MSDFAIRFWGVRGSYPAPGEHTVKFGGNTPCVQIQINQRLIILDAGTGICNLGLKLRSEAGDYPIQGDILITHAHWDHIQGFPFFKPAFDSGNSFNIFGMGTHGLSFREILQRQMEAPFFPVQLDEMKADLSFYAITPEEDVDLGEGIIVRTFANNHPNDGVSFRVEYAGRAFCYITDIEHCEEVDRRLARFAEAADLIVYDANYTEYEYEGGYGEFPGKQSWGHSTWEKGIELLRASNAKQLAFFHHDPTRSDSELEMMEAEVRDKAPDVANRCFAAREGMVIHL